MPYAIDDLFRRFGKALNKADVEEIVACVTDDFEWRLAAGSRPSGTVLKGEDDLRRYFADKSQAHREALIHLLDVMVLDDLKIWSRQSTVTATFMSFSIVAQGLPLNRSSPP